MEEGREIKLYLDEDVRPLLAKIMRYRGYDVVSAVEKNFTGLTDEEQIFQAIREQRAILSHNIKDFVKLHHKYWKEHFEILLSEQVPLRILLRRVLRCMSQNQADGFKGKLIWLSSFE